MYLVTRKIKVVRGQKQEFIDTWHLAIGSRLKRQSGFITAWLLTSPNDDEVMIMSQWKSEEHHRKWRQSDLYRQVQAHIGGLIEQRLGDKNYHIAAEVLSMETEE